MLSSLSGKLSVLQTSSADNLARQQFRDFNIFTEKLGLKNKGGVSKFAGFIDIRCKPSADTRFARE